MGIRINHAADAAIAGNAAYLAGQGQFAKERDRFAMQQEQFDYSRERDAQNHQLRVAQFMQQARQQEIANARSAQTQRQNQELAWRQQAANEQKAAMAHQLGQQKYATDLRKSQMNNVFDWAAGERDNRFEMQKLGQTQEHMLARQDNQAGHALERQREEQAFKEQAAAAEENFSSVQEYDKAIREQLNGLDPDRMTKAGSSLYKDITRKYKGVMDYDRMRPQVKMHELNKLMQELQQGMGTMKSRPEFNASKLFSKDGQNVVNYGNDQYGVFVETEKGIQFHKIDASAKQESFEHIKDPFARHVAQEFKGDLRKAVKPYMDWHKEQWKADESQKKAEADAIAASNDKVSDYVQPPYSPPSLADAVREQTALWQEEQMLKESMGMNAPRPEGNAGEAGSEFKPAQMKQLTEEAGSIYQKLQEQGVDTSAIPKHDEANVPLITLTGQQDAHVALSKVEGWTMLQLPNGQKVLAFKQGDNLAIQPVNR